MAGRTRCWLEHADGTRIRLTARGVLLGRGADCDVVLDNPRASRQQALVRVSGDGPELVPMGKNPIQVNGAPVTSVTALHAGDRLAVPGQEFLVSVEEGTRDERRPVAWALEHGQGVLYGLANLPFSVGSGPDDDLVLEGWPAAAVRFLLAQQALFVEAGTALVLNGILPLAEGAVAPVGAGDVIACGAETVRVIGSGAHTEQATVEAIDTPLPSAVYLTFLPRGGRLTLTFADGEVSTYLADRRCDLIAALLQPPVPFTAGEFIPDDVLVPRVWPSRDDMDRTDLNVLVHRVRKDLVKAGVNGLRLLERSPGGGATRLLLERDARVEVT